MTSSTTRMPNVATQLTIVIPQPVVPDEWEVSVASGEQPAHVMLTLARRLSAEVVTSAGVRPTWLDRLFGLFIGSARDFAVARLAVRNNNGDGVYYANGDTVGLAMTLIQFVRRRPTSRVGFYVHVPDGVRIRWLLRLIRLLRCDPVILSATPNTQVITERYLRRRGRRMVLLRSSLDVEFFTPRPTPPQTRPLIASGGLEKRDYVTLLRAVDGLDVDVVVCAISQNAARSSAIFPAETPENVSFQPLTMAELRDLYQRADATIVSCVPNTIDAGMTVSLEAGACGCPLLVTHTNGLLDLVADGVAMDAGVGDPSVMRQAIERVLGDRNAAREMAARGLERTRALHGGDVFEERFIEYVYAALCA
jgi:glycosyltransferase involved in cell wall biosynthesis